MRFTTAELAREVAEESRLRERLATVAEQIHDCTGEDGAFTGTMAETQYGQLNDEHIRLEASLRRVSEKVDRMNLWAPVDTRQGEESLMSRFIRGGVNGITADEATELKGHSRVGLPNGLPDHSISVGPVTPAPIPTGIQSAAAASDVGAWATLFRHEAEFPIVEVVSAFGGHQRMLSRFTSGDGNQLPIPQADDTNVKGVRMAQGETVSSTDRSNPKNVVFSAISYNSRFINWTREMAQDSRFNLEMWIRRSCAVRLGRVIADDTWGGTGAAGLQPHGVNTVARAALTTAGSGKVSWEDMIGLTYQVNRAYREGMENLDGVVMGAGGTPMEMGPGMGGRTGFIISDDLEHKARVWKDDDGRPLLLPSIRDGLGRVIGGIPFQVSMNAPAVSAGTKPAVYGNFGYHSVRVVETVEFFPFFDSNTVPSHRAVAFARLDARHMLPLDNAGKSPAIVALTVKS